MHLRHGCLRRLAPSLRRAPAELAAVCLACGVAALDAQRAVAFEAAEQVSDAAAPDANGPALADGTLPPILVTGDDPHKELREKNKELDEARDQALLPKLGATSYRMDQQAVEDLPQGTDTPLDKVLLRAPGVSYDSALSNPDFHVRNEYANVQYRLNGIQLPDGVSGLGPVLETRFIGSLNLLDGVLPAQYGLRTAGVIDIDTKSRFTPGASVDIFGGSQATLSPSFEVGGSQGLSQYFLTGRYLQSEQGLESPMATIATIHDRTQQGKLFAYGSTLLGEGNRLSLLAGGSFAKFQIPNVAGEQPLGIYGPPNLPSAGLDENETDRFDFGVLALQTHHGGTDAQISAFTRLASIDFLPDLTGDLAFNDVASRVERRSLLDGVQFDAAERLSETQALRAGLAVSAEQTRVDNLSTVLPLAASGTPLPYPTARNDADTALGWNFSAYAQDEWTLRPGLTLNTGLRYDELKQFVTAGQVSPRAALVWKPAGETQAHLGYARYFTPPMQAQATPSNLALFQGTTQQPAIALDDPLRPERADYLDAGVDGELSPELSAGADVFFKRATDPLDDGQFGQAVVLTQFNYARGFSRGVELKLDLHCDGLHAYANVSAEKTLAEQVITNQYLFDDPAEFAYLQGHYIYTDDAQTITASAGASYRSGDVFASLDGLFGSGLRDGFANLDHVPGYVQWNAAVSRQFRPWSQRTPLTLRLSVVNFFDRSYLLRSGDGIGVFAPQYGPRRGIFFGLTQRL